MNGTASKASNRQIRRAFGEEALDTINQQGETLANIVLPRLMTAGKSLETFDRRIGALEATAAHLAAMTRWQRLRWVCGW